MTSRKIWLPLFIVASLLGVLFPALAMAQADTRIAGTVRDSSGSAIGNESAGILYRREPEAAAAQESHE
jgi:hypothetical protein